MFPYNGTWSHLRGADKKKLLLHGLYTLDSSPCVWKAHHLVGRWTRPEKLWIYRKLIKHGMRHELWETFQEERILEQIGYMGTNPEKQTLKMLLRIRGAEVTSFQTLLYLWELYQIFIFTAWITVATNALLQLITDCQKRLKQISELMTGSEQQCFARSLAVASKPK